MKRYLNFDLDALALIFENSVPPSIMTNSESGSSSAAAAAAAEAVDPTEFPLWSLQRTQKELSQMLIREFDDAIQSFHEESILRLVKLFPMIGYGEIGLDKYSSFLSSLISRNSQDRMKAIGDTSKEG